MASAGCPGYVGTIATSRPFTLFLLSPANLGGERGALLLDGRGRFPLALDLYRQGAPLGDVFSFVSGLYFRGKLTYARAYADAPRGFPGVLVMTPAEGLRFADEVVTLDRLRDWATVEIDENNPRFTTPLATHANALAKSFDDRARFVLLGSVATRKYTGPLLAALGERLLFPPAFVGRGDMSRGALLLRAAREGNELPYRPLVGAMVTGSRVPRLPARAATQNGRKGE